ncbi:MULTISPECIES: restriction endonuclease subunit S [unclassified Microcystis]|uniref:restriction endonuclease subunit S n=1 Tax=unclassified Microcystis TaxID=2643300 RepID=UPI0022C12AA6|nr:MULTISPECIES: restriction endonuclease subunit S [unclassified Microcystis]MCA2693386.1 restriction endonuclease subunit S [Microcystis sp. M034S2]MCA2749747.1 restriction endonuclease subunit S [Microcystis sp. M144S2]MCZ8199050.1 restriction endonuclease subunit S [Microcystis sp. LE19-55.1A]MCZ8306577.1 restriction endonuclease subunit S [Microcystis sp. LE19-98.1E]
MTDSNSNYSDLPLGWKIVQLQDIGKIVSGGTPSTKVAEYWEEEICWISPADLSGYNQKYISKGNKSISKFGLENSSAKLMPKGSILFSSRAPIGYVAIASNSLATNQGFKSIIPNENIFNEYIYYYLKSAKQLAEKHANGTTFKEISAKAFASLSIPLPPLPEQHRIVEKIEELFSELDNGVASLKKALEQLKTYRQAVLKWAFEGKLTEKWRNTHQDSLEDADTLLEQIKAERKRHYQQQLADWKQALKEWENNGKETKKPTKPQQPKDLPPLTKEELSNLPSLPDGWMWVKLGNLCDIIGGVTKGRKLEGKNTISLPYLRVANVQDGYLDLSVIKYIEVLPEDLEKYRLVSGDILYTEGGDRDKLGRGTIWRNEISDCIHQNHVFRARTFQQLIKSLYISYFSQTQTARNHFFKHGKQTVNLASINMTVLSNLPIVLCSTVEQKLILDEIESRLSVCDQLEATLTENLNKAEALRQSILKRAFEGKLVL